MQVCTWTSVKNATQLLEGVHVRSCVRSLFIRVGAQGQLKGGGIQLVYAEHLLLGIGGCLKQKKR